MNHTTESQNAALTRARTEIIQRCIADPFLGYSTFEESIADAKFSSQAEAMARLFSGKNIFLSGPAGSGKTFLIERFRERLDAEYEGRVNVAVTASTGIAAQLLGGRTIHSWSGIGINTERFTQPSKMEWAKRGELESVDVLIIDEISMLPAYLFTRLDALLRYMRRSSEPFGGVQMVVMGDFMQLPPVGKKGEVNAEGEELDYGFCITTDAWKKASFRALYLDKVRRAKDPKLKQVLNSIATDKADEKTRKMIESRLGQSKDPAKKYMTLFTTNKNVDRFNDDKLAENPNPEQRINAQYLGNPKHWPTIKKSYGLNDFCKLKVGATVMLTANLNGAHANGSIGEVTFIGAESCVVRFNDGGYEEIEFRPYDHTEKTLVRIDKRGGKNVEIYEEQIVSTVLALPLKLGYAISVHKSQGQTFSAVEVDLSFVFSAGLGYVALSRVSSLDDLVIVGNRIHPDTYLVDQKSLRYSKATKKAALGRRQEMLKNIEDSKRYFSQIVRPAFEVEPSVTKLPTAESETVEAPVENSDPFASILEVEEVAVSNDSLADVIDPVEEAEELSAVPLGFISYEQLLVNPYTRANIWDKKVADRQARVEKRTKKL